MLFKICPVNGGIKSPWKYIFLKIIGAKKANDNKKLKIEHKKEFIIPTFEGRAGNPILVSKHAKEKITNVKGDYGAKEIIELNKIQ